MRRVMMTLMGLTLGLAATAPAASASYTYNVSFSVPAKIGPGTVTAAGTITVGILGGNLPAADVTGYSITLAAPGNAAMTLTQGNSSLTFTSGAVLSADTAGISLVLTNLGDQFSIIMPGVPQDFGYSLLYIYNYPNGISTFELDAGSTYGQAAYPMGAPFVLGTAASSIPEPSSLVLCGVAALAGLGAAQARGRRVGD